MKGYLRRRTGKTICSFSQLACPTGWPLTLYRSLHIAVSKLNHLSGYNNSLSRDKRLILRLRPTRPLLFVISFGVKFRCISAIQARYYRKDGCPTKFPQRVWMKYLRKILNYQAKVYHLYSSFRVVNSKTTKAFLQSIQSNHMLGKNIQH